MIYASELWPICRVEIQRLEDTKSDLQRKIADEVETICLLVDILYGLDFQCFHINVLL